MILVRYPTAPSHHGSFLDRFGTNNTTMLKLLTQENVLVGGFFVISGYAWCSAAASGFFTRCLHAVYNSRQHGGALCVCVHVQRLEVVVIC